jgi:hypothetical protein
MDGVILNYDQQSATGIVEAGNGKLFPFRQSAWRASVPPRRKDRVEFEAEGGEAKEIRFPKGQEPAGAAMRKVAGAFDMGWIAGVYAIGFCVLAGALLVLNVLLPVVKVDEAEFTILFGGFVLLDVLAAAAWMWRSRYRKMRAFAAIIAIGGTVAVAAILLKDALQGGA